MGMMQDHLKALRFEYPEHIPVGVSILPAAWIKHREALDEIVARHPTLFGQHKDRDYDAVGGTYVEGEHVDVWGCVWSNVKTGREAIVTGHPVPTREAVHALKMPEEDVGFPHGFMYLRLSDLRGFEEIMIDFAEEAPELQMLIDVVLAYNVRQAEIRLQSMEGEGQIAHFGDDLGMQNSLPISPQKWRKYLKPCYAKIYKPFREAGHYVYMHTDGHIVEIIPDLIDCGVNVVNPQIRANGLDSLAEVCKGKVCVDLDLDRQLFPFCTPEEIDVHVREAVEKLGSPEGGLWLKAEVADDVPLENVEAVCAALEKYRSYF
jgi:uroporphyrinogen decarboxylase